MSEPDRIARLLAKRRELDARQQTQSAVQALVAKLRSFYYPKQAAFYTSKHKRRATNKTRRSGATSGGCTELIARALETPRFRAVYATTTRVEARSRAWLNDTATGLVDILHQHGKQLDTGGGVEAVDMGGIRVDIRSGDLQLVFSNGSLIELFGADDERSINKLRGLAKHVVWVDEAQSFSWLERFYKSVIQAGSADHDGEMWLTGTPGRDCTGFFYDVIHPDEKPSRDADRSPRWEIHHFSVVDNPYFAKPVWQDGQWFVTGRPGIDALHGPFSSEEEAEKASVTLRWERTAGNAIQENGWDQDDPDLLREWYGRWVKEDARFVYDLHKVNEAEVIYAPQRLLEDGFPDIKTALLDLPGWNDKRRYTLGVGCDLGTTRAFAWSMVGWSLHDPVLYEVASWKMAGLDYDEMAEVLKRIAEMATVGIWVADAGGGGKPAVKGWSRRWMERYNIPIIEAEKPNKSMAQRQLNTDLRKKHLQFRLGSPVLAEYRTHRLDRMKSMADGLPESLQEDPRTHRDSADGYLYIHRHSYHHRYREPSPEILPNTPEWMLREERELEDVALSGPDEYWQ